MQDGCVFLTLVANELHNSSFLFSLDVENVLTVLIPLLCSLAFLDFLVDCSSGVCDENTGSFAMSDSFVTNTTNFSNGGNIPLSSLYWYTE